MTGQSHNPAATAGSRHLHGRKALTSTYTAKPISAVADLAPWQHAGREAGGYYSAAVVLLNNDVGSRFGRKLRELRKAQRMTQSHMAAAFGIDRSYISDMEHGKKGVSLATLEILALGFRMDISELLSKV